MVSAVGLVVLNDICFICFAVCFDVLLLFGICFCCVLLVTCLRLDVYSCLGVELLLCSL